MPRTYASRIHLVERRPYGVEPACGDWDRAVNWTTELRVATCPECLRRRAERTTARLSEASGAALAAHR